MHALFLNQMLKLTLSLLVLLTAMTASAQLPARPVARLQHVVLFKFKPETTPAKVTEIVAAFNALPRQIPTIRAFRWGTNNSPEQLDKGLTHAFILTFDSAKDRDEYLPHPAHKAFGQVVGPWLADITVVDFVEQ
jgi:hypothetical protein